MNVTNLSHRELMKKFVAENMRLNELSRGTPYYMTWYEMQEVRAAICRILVELKRRAIARNLAPAT